jgi:hypothetical protein
LWFGTYCQVVLAEYEGSRRLVAAFVLPNTAIEASRPLSWFLVSLSTLENLVGFSFFPRSASP